MKKISKKTANIIMAAVIVVIVAAGVFCVGCSNGWSEKNHKRAAVTEETITQTESESEKETTSKASNKEKETTKKTAEKQTEQQNQDENQEANQDTNQNSNLNTKPQESTKQAEKKATETEKVMTCTVSISCSTILNNMDKLNSAKKSLIPSDGQILYTTVDFTEGETAFDVVQRACSNSGIAIEYSWNPMYGSSYVEGINNIYEFDCGEQSGWMYKVNGWFPNYGSSSYVLSDGDTVSWVYTCTGLGADVGG